MRAVLDFVRRRRVFSVVLVLTTLFYGALALTAIVRHLAPPEAVEEQRVSEDATGADPAHADDRDLGFDELKVKEQRFRQRVLEDPRLAAGIGGTVVLVLSLGLLVNLWALLRRMAGKPVLPRIHEAAPPRWGRAQVAEAFVVILFVEVVLVLTQIGVSSVVDLRFLGQDFLLMANSLARNIIIAAYIIWIVRRRFGQPVSDLGLTTRGAAGGIGIGLVAYLAALPALFLTLIATAAFAQAVSYEPEPQKVVQIYLKESTERHLPFFTLFVAGLGPIIEEVFFRGFAYPAFRKRMGVGAALLASAAIFSLAHLNLVAFVPIVLLGVFLAYLYERTGSLVPSMTAHAVHNTIMLLFTLGFKNLSV